MKTINYVTVTCSKCGAKTQVSYHDGQNEPMPKGWKPDSSNRLYKKLVCKNCQKGTR